MKWITLISYWFKGGFSTETQYSWVSGWGGRRTRGESVKTCSTIFVTKTIKADPTTELRQTGDDQHGKVQSGFTKVRVNPISALEPTLVKCRRGSAIKTTLGESHQIAAIAGVAAYGGRIGRRLHRYADVTHIFPSTCKPYRESCRNCVSPTAI